MLQKSKNPHYRSAKKGMGWARKVYKIMLLNKCPGCGELMVNRTSKQKCDKCKEREWRLSRLKVCSCGSTFMLQDHQHGGERVCPACREGDYKFVFRRISDFISNPHWYWPHINMKDRIRKFASKSRNDVQSTTDYRNFKMYDLEFQNNNQKVPTMDHINAMTYIIEHYIEGCLSGKYKLDLDEFKDYYNKYAVQFPVSQKDNLKLREFQVKGVTPEEYISIVGPLKNLSIEESIEKIRKHFINE